MDEGRCAAAGVASRCLAGRRDGECGVIHRCGGVRARGWASKQAGWAALHAGSIVSRPGCESRQRRCGGGAADRPSLGPNRAERPDRLSSRCAEYRRRPRRAPRPGGPLRRCLPADRPSARSRAGPALRRARRRERLRPDPPGIDDPRRAVAGGEHRSRRRAGRCPLFPRHPPLPRAVAGVPPCARGKRLGRGGDRTGRGRRAGAGSGPHARTVHRRPALSRSRARPARAERLGVGMGRAEPVHVLLGPRDGEFAQHGDLHRTHLVRQRRADPPSRGADPRRQRRAAPPLHVRMDQDGTGPGPGLRPRHLDPAADPLRRRRVRGGRHGPHRAHRDGAHRRVGGHPRGGHRGRRDPRDQADRHPVERPPAGGARRGGHRAATARAVPMGPGDRGGRRRGHRSARPGDGVLPPQPRVVRQSGVSRQAGGRAVQLPGHRRPERLRLRRSRVRTRRPAAVPDLPGQHPRRGRARRDQARLRPALRGLRPDAAARPRAGGADRGRAGPLAARASSPHRGEVLPEGQLGRPGMPHRTRGGRAARSAVHVRRALRDGAHRRAGSGGAADDRACA